MNLAVQLWWASASGEVLGIAWLSASAVCDPILHVETRARGHASLVEGASPTLPQSCYLAACVKPRWYSGVSLKFWSVHLGGCEGLFVG